MINAFKKPITGMSHSTSIAASLAGMPLDSFRRDRMKEEIREVQMFQSFDSMAVLIRLLRLG